MIFDLVIRAERDDTDEQLVRATLDVTALGLPNLVVAVEPHRDADGRLRPRARRRRGAPHRETVSA